MNKEYSSDAGLDTYVSQMIIAVTNSYFLMVALLLGMCFGLVLERPGARGDSVLM